MSFVYGLHALKLLELGCRRTLRVVLECPAGRAMLRSRVVTAGFLGISTYSNWLGIRARYVP